MLFADRQGLEPLSFHLVVNDDEITEALNAICEFEFVTCFFTFSTWPKLFSYPSSLLCNLIYKYNNTKGRLFTIVRTQKTLGHYRSSYISKTYRWETDEIILYYTYGSSTRGQFWQKIFEIPFILHTTYSRTNFKLPTS